jgi:murein L,D-transpeptidase YcbB/YkuD
LRQRPKLAAPKGRETDSGELDLYAGNVNGELTEDTKEALKRFQIVKGLPASGLITTETLNALGVPAVQ